ncbi:MAG: ABC transporter substrate-binding protein [Candidatus Dormibacteria bacterium]
MTRNLMMTLAMGSTLLVAACGGSNSNGPGSGPAASCPVDAAAPSSKTAPPPSGSLLTPGTLTFGSDISYPPQEFYPDGCGGKSPDGFDLDVAKAVAARMGLKFAVVDTKFDGIIPALQTKKFDALVSAMTINDDRKKVVSFIPYFVAGESFVVTSDSKQNPQEIKDLCGLKVAVEKGTVEESDAADANDAAKNGACAKKPINFKDFSFDKDTQALAALKKGTVDVHFTDSPVASYELLKNTGYKITNKAPINSAPEGIATRKDDSAMTTAITAAFAALKSDGTYQKLLTKWQVSDGDIAKAS